MGPRYRIDGYKVKYLYHQIANIFLILMDHDEKYIYIKTNNKRTQQEIAHLTSIDRLSWVDGSKMLKVSYLYNYKCCIGKEPGKIRSPYQISYVSHKCERGSIEWVFCKAGSKAATMRVTEVSGVLTKSMVSSLSLQRLAKCSMTLGAEVPMSFQATQYTYVYIVAVNQKCNSSTFTMFQGIVKSLISPKV